MLTEGHQEGMIELPPTLKAEDIDQAISRVRQLMRDTNQLLGALEATRGESVTPEERSQVAAAVLQAICRGLSQEVYKLERDF